MEEKNISEKDEQRRMDDAKKDKNTLQAFQEAQKDIEKDPDANMTHEEDLDEGELARKEGHP